MKMVTTGADHSMMDRSLMILENEHALLEDKHVACEKLERYFNQLLQNKMELTPLKINGMKLVKILLQYVEQESGQELTIPALTALRPAVELLSKNVNFSTGMKLASQCYEVLLKSYKTCDTSCQAGILVEMFRCMSKFNDAQFLEAVTSRKTPYAELKEICESFMSPCLSSKEFDLNRQAVQLEALRFLKRFLRVVEGAVLTQIEREMCYWVDLLLQHMFMFFKENDKVGYREMESSIRQESREALELLLSKMPAGSQVRGEKWPQIKKNIRDVYADMMVKMVGTSMEWSDNWILILNLLDKELITKGNNHLINKLLNVEEKAFKYYKADVRMTAFTCWCNLIDKFIPSDCENYRESVVRSVRLLMQPLQANNARTEAMALQKLHTWWHLMHRLESCPDVLVTTVLSPFLVYCFGSPKLKDQCPGKKYLSLPSPIAKSLLFILDNRPEDHQDRKSEEILLHNIKQKIMPFRKPLLDTANLFFEISEELTYSVGECIITLSTGSNNECFRELIHSIWQFLLIHIQNALKSHNDQSVKVVQELLRLLRHMGQREDCTPVLLDYYITPLLEDIVKSSSALPIDVLAAPMYYVGNGPRFMAGTPALLLVECMVSQRLLPLIKRHDQYVSLLKYLIKFGIDHCNTLDFIQAVMKHMESLNSNTAEICLVWNIVASACTKYLKSGGQVNQGSDHQHDFMCLYSVLMFPLYHICSIPYKEASEVVLVWHELYKVFCRVTKSTVVTLDAVEVSETVANKLNQILAKHAPRTLTEAIAILKVVQDIVNSLPFSEVFGTQQLPKKRGRISCNISNVLNLVVKMSRLLSTFERTGEYFNAAWALLAIMIDVLFKNMKTTNVVIMMPIALHLSDTVNAVLQMEAVQDGTANFYNDNVLRMWKDYLKFMESSLSKKSLIEVLDWLCSSLEAGFKNKSVDVNIATIDFWDNCLYPLCHKEDIYISQELQKLRDSCGNAIIRKSVIVADSEDDNASDIQYSSNKEGKAIKEQASNSGTTANHLKDAVFALPETIGKGKPKSLVQQLKDSGHVLTRHQKEMLRSKSSDIPALYNSTLQPEEDSQYSQNSESSQDTMEFTGPSRVLEPAQQESSLQPLNHPLKVLEPPSSQRRLAEYHKKMMIDDEGSIILTALSAPKEHLPDVTVPVTSNIANSDKAGQGIELSSLEMLPSENSNALNMKLNLESVAVPMLGTVVDSNTSVSLPEVRISISSPPLQTPTTTNALDTMPFPLEQAPTDSTAIEHSSLLEPQSSLIMAPVTLQNLVKNTTDNALSEDSIINAPILLQDYVDFQASPMEFMNTAVTAPSKKNIINRSITEPQKELAMHESNASKSISDKKEIKSSANYFKAVSIALVDDDDDDDDGEDMLNMSVSDKCNSVDMPCAVESRGDLDIQEINQSSQGVDADAVKVVVEKVEDFSLNKTFAALETITASTPFDSAESENINSEASNASCSKTRNRSKANSEEANQSTAKGKGKPAIKDPVEIGLQKLFETEPISSVKHTEENTKKQNQKSSRIQKSSQQHSRSRLGRSRSKKEVKVCDNSTSPSLITGSKLMTEEQNMLVKVKNIIQNTVSFPDINQCAKEEKIMTAEKVETTKDKKGVTELQSKEGSCCMAENVTDRSDSTNLTIDLLTPDVPPAEYTELMVKEDHNNANLTGNSELDRRNSVAKSNLEGNSDKSKDNSQNTKPGFADKADTLLDKENALWQKHKRKRNRSIVDEYTGHKPKRRRGSKLPLEISKISSELEVCLTSKDNKVVSSSTRSVSSEDSNAAKVDNAEENNRSKEINTSEDDVKANIPKSLDTIAEDEKNKFENLSVEPDMSSTYKSSAHCEPNTLIYSKDFGGSHSEVIDSNIEAKKRDCSFDKITVVAENVENANQKKKNNCLPKDKVKISKKGNEIQAPEKREELFPVLLRKLRSTVKCNIQKGVSALVKKDENMSKENVSVSVENDSSGSRNAETEHKLSSPSKLKSQTVSDLENNDSLSPINSVYKSKSVNRISKNDTESEKIIDSKLTKEPLPESQDVIESSQSNPSPTIFSWNHLKTCSVVVKKFDANLEPGSKVNLDEKHVLVMTPDSSSPYKICSQELESLASVITTRNNHDIAFIEKMGNAKRNFQKTDGLSELEIHLGLSKTDEAKKVLRTNAKINSLEVNKEKNESSAIRKSVISSPGKKSKSPVMSNDEHVIEETCKYKETNPVEEIVKNKPKRTYIQPLITEVISNSLEKKERNEITASKKEGTKNKSQKMKSYPLAKIEAQSVEKPITFEEKTSVDKYLETNLCLAPVQNKSDITENSEKNHCDHEEQTADAPPVTTSNLEVEAKTPTKKAAILQALLAKSIPVDADKDVLKPHPVRSEPVPANTEMKSKAREEESVNTKQPVAVAEAGSSSKEAINTQIRKADTLLVGINIESKEETIHPIVQKRTSSVIPKTKLAKKQGDNESLHSTEKVADCKEQSETLAKSIEATVGEAPEKCTSEKVNLKSKSRKTKTHSSISETGTSAIGTKENIQPFISIEEVVKSKAQKLRAKMLENNLSIKNTFKPKEKRKYVRNAKGKIIKSTDQLMAPEDISLVNSKALNIDSSNKSTKNLETTSNSPSLTMKEKQTSSEPSKIKEAYDTWEQTAKVKQKSLKQSKIESSSEIEASHIIKSKSSEVLENENNNPVPQTPTNLIIDHVETSKSCKKSKIKQASSDPDKENVVKDQIVLQLPVENLNTSPEADYQDLKVQEAVVEPVSPNAPGSGKVVSRMQQHVKEISSEVAVSKRKTRGRPRKLNGKAVFPLSRKRRITPENIQEISKNSELEATPRTPKLRKLFNTDGHMELIITPSVSLQNMEKEAKSDSTEVSSTPQSSKSASLLQSPIAASAPTEISPMETAFVPAPTSPKSTPPAKSSSAQKLAPTPASNLTSPLTTHIQSSPPSCLSPKPSPSKTSPPKTSPPKMSSPKSLLSSPSSLLRAFSSSPSTTDPKHNRVGHHSTLAGRAQFLVGLALVSKEGKDAAESSAEHDFKSSATKVLFTSSPTENPSTVDSLAQRETAETASLPLKRRSLLIDPKRRLSAKKKRVSFSETPQTILYECHANEKQRMNFKSNKIASSKYRLYEKFSPKKVGPRPNFELDNSDDEVTILPFDSEVTSCTIVQDAASPDVTDLLSQGSLEDVRTELLNSQQPIFPQLINCNHPIEAVVAQLTNHPMWTKAFLNEMYQRNIRTIGDLSRCDEVTVNRLPIPVPKVAHTKKVLQEYQKNLSILPRRGFWDSIGSRLLEQEPSSSSSPSPPPPAKAPSQEGLVHRTTVIDCAKFLANSPKSLHVVLEEASKLPNIQDKLRKEIEAIYVENHPVNKPNEAVLDVITKYGIQKVMEVGSQQQLDKMAEYMLSHLEQYLNKMPTVDLYKYLTARHPEETEKWILEWIRTCLRSGSFGFLEKLNSLDCGSDLLNILQSYIMMKRPIADILQKMPIDSVLHFATSKLSLTDKIIMCGESLVTDNSIVPLSDFQKLMNAIVEKMKMSESLNLITHIIVEKLKSIDS